MLLSQIMQVKTRKPGGQECGPNIRKRTRGMRINDVWPDGLMNLMIVATHSRRFRVPFPSVTSQRGDFIGGKPENAEVWEKFVLVPWPLWEGLKISLGSVETSQLPS